MAKRKKIVVRYYNSRFGVNDRITEFSITDKETDKGIYGAVVGKWMMKKITKNKLTSDIFLNCLFEGKPVPFPHQTPMYIYEFELVGDIKSIIKNINEILEKQKHWKRIKSEK